MHSTSLVFWQCPLLTTVFYTFNSFHWGQENCLSYDRPNCTIPDVLHSERRYFGNIGAAAVYNDDGGAGCGYDGVDDDDDAGNEE